jgi:hypothetical protein
VVVAGCASRQPSSPAAATKTPAIARAKAEDAKARAAEAKAKAPASSSAGSSAGSPYRSPTVFISYNPDNYTTEVGFGGDWDFTTSTATLFIGSGDGRSW